MPRRPGAPIGREPNELLREARRRHGLTRRQLADAVNAVDDADPDHPMTAHDVGKLEQGLVRWPMEHRRRALRAVLGAAEDAELGLYNLRA
ncbi:hypothetical protein Ani05nite_08050 [Amorphoplanes nipponensis]|uniref:Helix-turn-helix domain-containing protein n=1 Tax=Actinoplanes nipponensis TaxID=135950 RepID=A0A919MJB1_9ACTN|nr:hypothetical protein Ani05nite_08050 [Actinoplanes nipponensis]